MAATDVTHSKRYKRLRLLWRSMTVFSILLILFTLVWFCAAPQKMNFAFFFVSIGLSMVLLLSTIPVMAYAKAEGDW